MNDYGKPYRDRLLKNDKQEEIAENLAGWVLCVTIVFLTVHLGVFFWRNV